MPKKRQQKDIQISKRYLKDISFYQGESCRTFISRLRNLAELETSSKRPRQIAIQDEIQKYNSRDHHHRRVGNPVFHANKDEIAATRVAGIKVQRITGKIVFTATKDCIQTIKGTKETNNQHSAITGDKTKIVAIVIQTSLSGKTITMVAGNKQIYRNRRLLHEEI